MRLHAGAELVALELELGPLEAQLVVVVAPKALALEQELGLSAAQLAVAVGPVELVLPQQAVAEVELAVAELAEAQAAQVAPSHQGVRGDPVDFFAIHQPW